jgi:hypothetical protein
MAGKSNPFSRAIATKKAADEPVTPVDTAPAIEVVRDDELTQASGDGNPDPTNDAGSDDQTFGLADTQRPAKEGVASVQDDAAAAAEAPPESKADRFGLDVSGATEGGLGDSGGAAGATQAGQGLGSAGAEVVSSGGIPAGINSPKQDLEAASGDHGPAIDLTEAPSLELAASNLSQGEALAELGVAFANASLDAAAATESEPSVADGAGRGAVGAAAGTVATGALANVGIGAAVDALTAAGGASAGAAAGVGAASGLAVGAVGLGAFVATTLADEATDGVSTEILTQLTAAVPLVNSAVATASALGNAAIAINDTATEIAATNAVKEEAEKKKAAEEEAKKKAEEEAKKKAEEEAKKKAEEEAKKKEEEEAKKKADAGTSTDPEVDERLTPEQQAAVEAIKAELGLVRIPGDIDPGDGDGTNTGKGSEANLSAADHIKLGGATTLVGNPGSPDAGEPAPAGNTGALPPIGPDGREIQLEDGDNFGVARGEDEPDFNVGADPLVGLSDSEDEAQDEDEGGLAKASALDSLFSIGRESSDEDGD